jgi:hypothetical protein
MKRTDPPSLATWMLEHMTPGACNHALAGDLFESFRAGRSSAWYWRQVLHALLIRYARELRSHRAILLFAFFWSMLAPAWLLAVAELETSANVGERLSRFDWPRPILCDLTLLLASNLLFIWLGIFLYLYPEVWAERRPNLRSLRRGIGASLPVLVALWAVLLALPGHFLAVHKADSYVASEAHPIPPPASTTHAAPGRFRVQPSPSAEQGGSNPSFHPLDPRQAITDLGNAAILARMPFFLAILCTLWSAAPRARPGAN